MDAEAGIIYPHPHDREVRLTIRIEPMGNSPPDLLGRHQAEEDLRCLRGSDLHRRPVLLQHAVGFAVRERGVLDLRRIVQLARE